MNNSLKNENNILCNINNHQTGGHLWQAIIIQRTITAPTRHRMHVTHPVQAIILLIPAEMPIQATIQPEQVVMLLEVNAKIPPEMQIPGMTQEIPPEMQIPGMTQEIPLEMQIPETM